MDKEKTIASGDKYIPPHRRRNNNDNAVSTETTTRSASKPVNKRFQESNQSSHRSLFFTSHASLRQEQRKISTTTINKTITQGDHLPAKESTTHIDENIQVVLSRNGTVITVQDNKRNVRHDLLHTSKKREKELIKEVELNNNDFAMCELAEIYLSGDLGNREVQKAYELLLRAAERRNSHAMCLISKLYEEGDLGAIDLKKALEWLEKAAERRNKYALAILGQRFLQEYLQVDDANKKCEKNQLLLQKVLRYLRGSAAKGSTRAMWQIGKIYEEGWLGEKNLVKAIEHYSEAANLGSPTSLYELQRLVTEEKFAAEAFEIILEKASNLIAKTSSELAVEIGLAQIRGKLGTKPTRGFSMLEQAAKRNNNDAIFELAMCYQFGLDCNQDLERARYWYDQLKILYEKAIELGNINAMLRLGNIYLRGIFGKIDLECAEKLFIRAANEGDIFAIYYLGTLYIKGRLGDHDPCEGIPWINKAVAMWSEQASKGNTEAAEGLVNLYLNKRLGFKDYQKAARWLSFLAGRGNNEALMELLSLYLKRKINLANDKDHLIFSENILTLLKKKAVDTDEHEILLALAQLYQENYLLHEENKDANPWTQKLEALLSKKGKNEAEAALLLGKLYNQEESILPKNLQQTAKWLCLASCLSTDDVACREAEQELKVMSKNKSWNEVERKQILAGILDCANQVDQKEPYKIGRILGDIYSKGNLIDPDFQQAFKWYEIAAKLGNSKAMYRLGSLLLSGSLGPVEIDTAIKWFESASQKGHQKTIKELMELGKLNNINISSKNANKIKKQIDKEDNKACKDASLSYCLAQQYKNEDHEYVKDVVQAAHLLRKAAECKHAGAAFELAQLYNSGKLGEKARPVAVSFFKLAAKCNHLEAMNVLIDLYSKGNLVKADPQQVFKWQMRLRNLKKDNEDSSCLSDEKVIKFER